MREFIDGAEAIARAALAAGCTFFAGYPITPATPILLHLLRELPKLGGIGIQAEDEIAAISVSIGAAMTGARAMTATSGPGISLFSENIGLAIMGEVPLVIVDVMRLGPATGGATTGAQGDVQFLRWGTSGGYPVIALCPTNVSECYTLTIEAFALAERFRTPVFLATDKETIATQTVVDTLLWHAPGQAGPAAFPSQTESRPDFNPALAAPLPFAPLGGDVLVRFTGSTHDEEGMLTKEPARVERLNRRLHDKIQSHAAELERAAYDPQAGAETVVIAFGVTARSVREALQTARAAGCAVSQLTVYSLWPVPETLLRSALSAHRRVIVPELNHGQYLLEIDHLAGTITPRPQVTGLNRVDGEMITPRQILEEIGFA